MNIKFDYLHKSGFLTFTHLRISKRAFENNTLSKLYYSNYKLLMDLRHESLINFGDCCHIETHDEVVI